MSKLQCKYQFFVSGLEDTTVALDEHEKDALARLALRAVKQKLSKFMVVRPRSRYPQTIEKIISIVENNIVRTARGLASLLPANNIDVQYVIDNAKKIKEALNRTLGIELVEFDEVFVD